MVVIDGKDSILVFRRSLDQMIISSISPQRVDQASISKPNECHLFLNLGLLPYFVLILIVYIQGFVLFATTGLERRLCVLEQHLEVCLVPLSRLRARLERITQSTERVVALGRCVASTITLTTRLDPHKRVDVGRSCVSSRSYTESSAVHVAPVTPFLA